MELGGKREIKKKMYAIRPIKKAWNRREKQEGENLWDSGDESGGVTDYSDALRGRFE